MPTPVRRTSRRWVTSLEGCLKAHEAGSQGSQRRQIEGCLSTRSQRRPGMQDLNDDAVGAGRERGQGEWLDEAALTAGVARIGKDRQMRHPANQRDRADIQG